MKAKKKKQTSAIPGKKKSSSSKKKKAAPVKGKKAAVKEAKIPEKRIKAMRKLLTGVDIKEFAMAFLGFKESREEFNLVYLETSEMRDRFDKLEHRLEVADH